MSKKPSSPANENSDDSRRSIVDAAARALIEAPEGSQFEVLQRMLETYLKAFRRAYPTATEDEIAANVMAYGDAITARKAEIERG
jgi:hypothetical protein